MKKNKPLSLKTILLFLVIPFLLLIIITVSLFYSASSNELTDMLFSNTQNVMSQTTDSLNESLAAAEKSATTITDNSLYFYMKQNINQNTTPILPKNYYTLANTITNFYSQNTHYFESIALYLDNASIQYYRGSSTIKKYLFSYSEFSDVLNTDSLTWINTASLNPYETLYPKSSTLGMMELLGNKDSTLHGFICFNINSDLLFNEISNVRITSSSFCTIVHDSALLFLDRLENSNKTRLDEETKTAILSFIQNSDIKRDQIINRQIDNVHVFYKASAFDGIGVLSIIPVNEMYLNQKSLLELLISIFVVAIVISTIIYFITTKMISKPVIILKKKMEQVYKDDLDVPFDVTGSKEIIIINRGIKKLVRQTNELISKVKIESENLRISELKALNAQINPHFLYNTLDSIYQLCEMQEYKKAQSMTKSLEVFYRIGVSKGVDIISFQEELTHVEVYLSILKTRFEDFQYEIIIPKELYTYRVIKLMLQPIVENAIYHGIRPVRLDGLIRIEAKQINNDMQLSISDNGAGITEEIIEQIQNSFCTDRKETEKTNVYGMRNVHHRIRLTYGSPYGLSIESELEVGTTIHILIPLISKEEN